LVNGNRCLEARRLSGLIVASLLIGLVGLSSTIPAAIGPVGAKKEVVSQTSGGATKVVDAVGRPLAGVAVMIQRRPLTLFPENLIETTATITDSNGNFQPPEREVGDTYFVLRRSGLEALAMEANRPVPTKITMRAARSVQGQVLDSAGQPIANALIGPVIHPPTMRCLDHWEHRNPMARQLTRSENDGTFKLHSLSVEPVAVQVSAAGYQPRLVVIPAGETKIKVGLVTGGAIITGNVIGSKDRAPQGSIPIEARSDTLVLYSFTDNQGTYAFDNMPTGTWNLRPAGGGPLSGTQSRAQVFEVEKLDGVHNVPLVLNQGILLAGRAIDALTSEPLPGINITLAGYAGRGAKAVLTDRTGSFEFENLDSLQDVLLRFDPVKFVYLPDGGSYRDYFDINQVGDTNFDLTTITLPLHRRLEVQGVVRDSNGKPVPDVEVRLQAIGINRTVPTKSGPGSLVYTAYSNGEGKFHTGVYPPGEYKVWAQQEALVSQVKRVAAFTTSPVAAMDLRLNQAAKLSGMVTDAKDRPVTNSVVIAWPSDGVEPQEEPIPGRESYHYTKTDMKGQFELTGLRGEPIVIRASHKDYVQPVQMPVDPAALPTGTTAGLVLKFPGGGEFVAEVTNESGSPVSGAEVRLEYQVDLDGRLVTVTTDQFGRAFVGSLPTTKLNKVTVTHPVFSPFTSEEPVALPASSFKVRLQKRGSLVAKVSGEHPVAGTPVEIFLLNAADSSSEKAPEQGYQEVGRSGVVAGQAVFANLPPGWYKAAFADSGAYAETDPVMIAAGSGDHEVALTLPKANHLVGLVKDKTTGEGIPGANVTLRPAIDSDSVGDRAMQNTVTGDGGTFELYNVGVGTLKAKVVVAGYPDYEREVVYRDGDTLEIELNNTPATLTGHVTVSGAAVEGALAILSRSGVDQSPVATGVTDGSGAYKLDGFPVGNYSLSIEAPIGEGENISRKTVAVNIEDENATQDVQFQAPVNVTGTMRLNGKVIKRDGGEVTLLFQARSGTESKMLKVSPDGTFTGQLEPGDYTVSLEDQGGVPVEIKPGSGQELKLEF